MGLFDKILTFQLDNKTVYHLRISLKERIRIYLRYQILWTWTDVLERIALEQYTEELAIQFARENDYSLSYSKFLALKYVDRRDD